MRVIRKSIVSWEPLVMRVSVTEKLSYSLSAFRNILRSHLEERPNSSKCNCTIHYLEIVEIQNPPGYKICVEWMCEACLKRFIAFLESRFDKSISEVQIGLDPSKPAEVDRSLYRVPEKEVTFEDQQVIKVSSFAIAKNAVTAGQFDSFVQSTNYVPIAILRGQELTYKNNHAVQFHGDYEPSDIEARYLCWKDAIAYCSWAKVRLPTEAEWLSASLISDVIYSPQERHAVQESIVRKSERLMNSGLFLTSTKVGSQVVARKGPFLLKTVGWERERNRLLLGEEECVAMFYVCSLDQEGTDS